MGLWTLEDAVARAREVGLFTQGRYVIVERPADHWSVVSQVHVAHEEPKTMFTHEDLAHCIGSAADLYAEATADSEWSQVIVTNHAMDRYLERISRERAEPRRTKYRMEKEVRNGRRGPDVDREIEPWMVYWHPRPGCDYEFVLSEQTRGVFVIKKSRRARVVVTCYLAGCKDCRQWPCGCEGGEDGQG